LAATRARTLLRSTPYRHHPVRILLPGNRSRRGPAAAAGVRAALASTTARTSAETALGTAHRQLRAGVLPRRSAQADVDRHGSRLARVPAVLHSTAAPQPAQPDVVQAQPLVARAGVRQWN